MDGQPKLQMGYTVIVDVRPNKKSGGEMKLESFLEQHCIHFHLAEKAKTLR